MGFFLQAAGLVSTLIVLTATISSGFPLGKRLYRSLPSVSDNHYSEIFPDGTYKYAYTGQDSYTAERKLSDGTVEGETVYVRPDGIPVKVHYFADANGYRPKTDILYNERLVKGRNAIKQKVIVPEVIYKEVEVDKSQAPPEPSVHLAPPPRNDVGNNAQFHNNAGNNVQYDNAGNNAQYDNAGNNAQHHNNAGNNAQYHNNAGNNAQFHDQEPVTPVQVVLPKIDLSNNDGSDVAVAEPSITAIVGPGSHTEITPEALSKAAGSKGHRSNGGKSFAKPNVIAVIGPASTVTISPRASALSGTNDEYLADLQKHKQTTYPFSGETQEVRRRQPLTNRNKEGPKTILEEIRPLPSIKEVIPVAYSTPEIDALKSHGALIIAPKASYSYEYAYSSPDVNNPSYGLNRAYVNVRVNQ